MDHAWKKLNATLYNLSHDYLLITIAGVLFFLIQAYIGYRTYQHYNRKLDKLEKKLDEIRSRLK
ncbi:hypothetical protein [Brevibacillus fulvus]|uniref:Uncharacterized protein n=1 Tax=Brevibacillus fulvus TaxID=1125967 RepID=A0A939BR18_9BACL|nr:hypothetical protein [Brevibacillus fulvus]MBM7589112.1 hypothetical protein [Brevibacillus fulvus]